MVDMEKRTPSKNRDTIPRIQQIVPHMRDQLIGLRQSATFEQARILYAKTVDRLVLQGHGRRTASRVGDRDRYWSPTREILDEAMRLGFVERQQLPSSRQYVDAHRNRFHKLTELGYQAADEAETNMPKFCDRLASAVYDNHPYFQEFVESLRNVHMGCPEISEGEVEQARRSGFRTDYLVEYAAERIPHDSTTSIDKNRIRDSVVSVMRQRFGTSPDIKPSSKKIAEALNDAYIEAAITIRDLSCGAIDLKMMKTWGSQLRLLDQSRYIPNFLGQNVIWLAADVIDNGNVILKRRTIKNREQYLKEAVVAAYREQASKTETSLRAPYLPIYRVRAQAAFNNQVTRALIDLVIERLATSPTIASNIQVLLHLGTTRQPDSEPVYRRGGNRRYEITIQPRS